MKKTLGKDSIRSIRSTKGRFLSLFLLMALGSFALVGIKVSGPNLEKTAQKYIKEHRIMDVSIKASHGFSKDDIEELHSIPDSKVELSHQVDANFEKDAIAIRLQSPTKQLSLSDVKKGKLPQTSQEIALSSWFQNKYKLGDIVRIGGDQKKLLKNDTYRLVGFYDNPEIWSRKNLGISQSGDGNLEIYGLLDSSAFLGKKNLARISYNDLEQLNAFTSQYDRQLQTKERNLEKVFQDNSNNQLKQIQEKALSQLSINEEKLVKAQDEIRNKEKALHLLSGESLKLAQTQLTIEKKKLEIEAQKLKQSKTDILALPKPIYLISNRQTLPGGEGYQVYHSSTLSIANVGNIFPVVLYLVAALVTFTTMTRFVDEERTNSGLLLAIGYDKKDVFKKFLYYGFLSGAFGTLLGVFGGTYVLSAMIVKICTNNLILENIAPRFYWSYTGMAFLLATLSSLLPVYLVVKKELKQAPAQLLLPKPPGNGSKVFLEKFPFIWKKLNFTQKVTVRNIFRYKLRMLMTIVGVAGSVALLFSGLGIQSSLSKVSDKQFNHLTPYDILMVTKANTNNMNNISKLVTSESMSSYKKVMYANLDLVIKGQSTNQKVSIISSPEKTLKPHLILEDNLTKNNLTIPKKGILISSKLASFYHVKSGQSVILTDKDNRKRKVTIAHVIDMRVGHYIIMSQDYYLEKFKSLENRPAYFVKLKSNSPKNIKKVSQELLASPEVLSLSKNLMIVDYVRSIVSSLNHVMGLLIVLSVVLSLVILYNLTTINISERIRELSTIKVLGFFDKEVTFYIFRETILLSSVGVGLGLILGYYIHRSLMSLMGASQMNFGWEVDYYVYLVPILAILLLIMLLGFVVHYHLKKLDMLEALKSVD
ncbi:FtsX-like permease family protein [Streptococcus hongkongensis]